MVINKVSVKSYSFTYSFTADGGTGTINTGLFIPGNVVIFASFVNGIITGTSGAGNATYKIGWTGSTAALFATQVIGTIVAGTAVVTGQVIPVLIPATKELIMTIAVEAITAGKAQFVFLGVEM